MKFTQNPNQNTLNIPVEISTTVKQNLSIFNPLTYISSRDVFAEKASVDKDRFCFSFLFDLAKKKTFFIYAWKR
jgi:hypothetical protein